MSKFEVDDLMSHKKYLKEFLTSEDRSLFPVTSQMKSILLRHQQKLNHSNFSEDIQTIPDLAIFIILSIGVY